MKLKTKHSMDEFVKCKRVAGHDTVLTELPVQVAYEICRRAEKRELDESDEGYELVVNGVWKMPTNLFDFEGEAVPAVGEPQRKIEGTTPSRRKVKPGDTGPQKA